MNQLWVCMCPKILNTLPNSLCTASLGLPQSTSFKCPASCIELALVICFTYGNIRVSMLSFHIVPPLPSPPIIQNSVLYICDCAFYRFFFFLSCHQFLFFFLFYQCLICDPRCDLSWRMFHVHLRRKCVLLLWNGMECL